MKDELAKEGKVVAFVAINKDDAKDFQAELTTRCSYPLFQDTVEVNAWGKHQGFKDDFYIYDSSGKLARYLKYGGDVDTNLSDATAYANVKKIITDTK